MVISLKKIMEDLKVETPDLITRPLGKSIFDIIRKKINIIQENETVLLDFEGIKVIDSSFIDELIIKLVLLSRQSLFPFFIKLKNISRTAEINIDLVLNSYSNYNRDIIAVITADICRNNSYFIGPLSEREKDIVDYLRINKEVTVDDLVKFTGSSSQVIKRTMEKLYSLRVIKKRKETVYMPV